MRTRRHVLEGLKMVALLGAIALVVWSMPDLHAQDGDAGGEAATTAAR